MKRTYKIGIAVSVFQLFSFSAFPQGSLTPPGPPGPTMKSLDQIDAHVQQVNTAVVGLTASAEKRNLIPAPVIITAPGSYLLTSSVAVPAGYNGIEILVSDVTIDLNGFSIIGQGASATLAGVQVDGTQKNICVTNGTITGFHGAGISGDISSSRFDRLIIDGNGGPGISITDNNEVRDCVITHNGGGGILMGSGCRVVQSIVSANIGRGIHGVDQSTVESCTVAGNVPSIGVDVDFGSVVRNCTVRGNGDIGIAFSGGSQIIGNTVDANGGDGLYTTDNASRIEANTATYNHSLGFSIVGGVNLVVRNSARGNKSGSVNDNYNQLQNSTTNVFGHIIDMSAPGLIPDSFGALSNISY
jgi:hypothetical protein